MRRSWGSATMRRSWGTATMGRSWRPTTMRRPPSTRSGRSATRRPPLRQIQGVRHHEATPPTITARSTVTVDVDRRSRSVASGSGCASDLWRRRREGSPPGFGSGLG
ncbi:hypothetical protein GN958_ATG02538 [Phytophthora infestans]|uniref:Uncharacterized protein n=1 Tax=Phytophthora infestans TaxID=4787 RepID=A0A8S9V5L0_PHYIN|nr:hypothetical protein GN958_ATG02538 [Phytophthora infestans]